jgi:hypothetical protein
VTGRDKRIGLSGGGSRMKRRSGETFPLSFLSQNSRAQKESYLRQFPLTREVLHDLHPTLRIAIYHELTEHGLEHQVDPPILSSLKADYQTNTARNDVTSHELREVLTRFSAENIPVQLLKGAIYLVVPVFPHFAIRFMSDIDLLVSDDDFGSAQRLMRQLGYQATTLEKKRDVNFEHPERLCAIDLHSDQFESKHSGMIPSASYWKNAVTKGFQNIEVRIPSPTDQLWHLFYHSYFRHSYLSRPDAPEVLYEAWMLVNKYATELDYLLLLERANTMKYEKLFDLMLLFLERHCDLSFPPQFHQTQGQGFVRERHWFMFSSAFPKSLYYALGRFNKVLLRSGGLIEKLKCHFRVVLIDSVIREDPEVILEAYGLRRASWALPLLKVVHALRVVALHVVICFLFLLFSAQYHFAQRRLRWSSSRP